MITDKYREELRELTRQIRSTKMDVVFFDYGWNECAEIIMRYVDKRRAESAEQARKEAADRFCASCHGKEDGMCGECPDRAVILNSPVKEGKTDAEKLAIAVKALEHASISIAKTDGDYDALCVVRDALKEIQ